VGDSVAHLA
jgi:hypothetical protein